MKSHLASYARAFAEAGYVAMVFDYRGWGESDGRIIATAAAPPLLEAGERTLTARVLREIVDPVDQTTDARNCLAVLAAEPDVDPARIGIWGTSYGGGHAVFLAGHDDRIRAVVAQIGGFGFPWEFQAFARGRTADKAHGRIDPPVPQDGLYASANPKGTPDVARMGVHAPLAAAMPVRVPTLIIDAEHEELINRMEHGHTAHMIIRQNAPSEYRTFPSRHYAVYEKHHDDSIAMALGWFDRYLPPARVDQAPADQAPVLASSPDSSGRT